MPKWLAAFLFAAMGCASAFAQTADAGLYVPTPQSIVDAMLEMGGVTGADHVIDLGSGDGRIVRTAVRRMGASGTGVEIDQRLVVMANEAAKQEGVSARAQFVSQDLWTFDTSRATVVTVYLLPSALPRLKQKLLAELKPGTRIVAHDYAFPDWVPNETRVIHEALKLAVNGTDKANLYLYIVPPRR
jgi:cyclopropane fatty-acyl-phospholipid synthase-like methyltransferase